MRAPGLSCAFPKETSVQVDIWTDVVCPWCYIGITRFERALERFDGEVDVRIHPFQLDAEAPIPGIPALERYQARFGDEAPAIIDRVTGEAAKDGLEMRFDRALAANTFDAHRAIVFARDSGKARALEMSLYRAYFTDGLDVSDRGVLADRAAEVGIDRDAIAAYLASDEGVDEVRQELVDALDRGITGVPAFLFEEEFLVPGAVDTDTFVRILEQMRAMRASEL